MRYLTLAAMILMTACSSTTTDTAATTTTTTTTADSMAEPGPGHTVLVLTPTGTQLGKFTPRSARYSDSEEPAVIAWLPGSGGVDEQGRAVPGVKFIGWIEGGWTHVVAYALVAQPGQTDLHNPSALESRLIGEYVMHSSESAPVAELARYGVTPLILKTTGP